MQTAIQSTNWSTPNEERDVRPCEEMMAMMEAHIDRERWFIFEDYYAANESDMERQEELKRLLGRRE